MLAFLTHTALGWLDQRYAAVHASLSSRKKFFNDLRALLSDMSFKSWTHWMEFVLRGVHLRERPAIDERFQRQTTLPTPNISAAWS